MHDLVTTPAVRLVKMLRRKEISSRELTDTYLSWNARQAARLNAVVAMDPDQAHASARVADEQLAKGAPVGRLHGLPITIKDSWEAAGFVSTGGDPALAGRVSGRDAPTVARLREAGAVVLGKTNVPFRSGDGQSYNEHYGTTNNPWDIARTPGGSSGGAAAALSAGLTALDVGGDVAGSIRMPAAFCGIHGLRTSTGVLPVGGSVGKVDGSESSMAVPGPMGRTAADLALGWEVLADTDGTSSIPWRVSLPDPSANTLSEISAALWLEPPWYDTDTTVVSVLHQAATDLADAGLRVETGHPDVNPAEAIHLFRLMLISAASAQIPSQLAAQMRERARSFALDDWSPEASVARALSAEHRDWLGWNVDRLRIRAAFDRLFETVDVILCPTSVVPAFPHDHSQPSDARSYVMNGRDVSYNTLIEWSGLAALAHLPSLVLPAGRTHEGLPVGLQVIGPHLSDRSLLRFAALAEPVLGGYVAPPQPS
ncbi:MAG: amidase family protein [Knoellia sp.]